MPNRIIKESVWTSTSLSSVSLYAQGFFLRLLPLPDDHGCFDARPSVLLGRLFPLQLKRVKESDIQEWLEELISIDSIRLWVDSRGVPYGFFPSWTSHQQIRSIHHRKTPIPPKNITDDNYNRISLDISCNQLLSVDALNPNPNLNPNPIKTCAFEISFSVFYSAYPKKKAKQDALKAWLSLEPTNDLVEKIISSLEKHKRSLDWTKDDGKYIPLPASWIRGKRWEDETDPPGVMSEATVVPSPQPKSPLTTAEINLRKEQREKERIEREFDEGMARERAEKIARGEDPDVEPDWEKLAEEAAERKRAKKKEQSSEQGSIGGVESGPGEERPF